MAKERIQVAAGRDGWVMLRRMPVRRWHLHRHDEFELNLVTRGRSTYLIDGRRVQLERDHLVALFPAQEHLLIDESPDHEMWIAVWRPEVSGRLLRGPRAAWAAGTPSGRTLWRLDARRGRALAGIAAAASLLRDDLAVNAALAALLLAAWDMAAAAPSADSTEVHPAVAAAAHRLRVSPTIGATALAAAVGLGRARLSRLFRAQVGVPLTAFRNRVRLERARDLLADGRATLLDAALGAGFGSYAQFHRVVRAQLGVSPRELLP